MPGPAFANDAAPPVHTVTYSGDQQPLAALDAEIAAAGRDAEKLASIETRLLTALRRRDSTFAGRQAICERLGLVLAQGKPRATADAYKPLPAMLVDDRESDLARLALERVPGPVVDGMFVNALEKSSGRARLGLIHSLAARRAPTAVNALASLLKDANAETVTAVIRALGEIATPEAIATLRTAPAQDDPRIVTAKLAAARRLPANEAKALVAEMRRDAQLPAQRVAALRLALELDRANAPERIVDVLSGNDWSLKQAALDALADLPADTSIVPQLAAQLPSLDAPTQAAVLAALAQRPDRAAVSAVMAAAAHPDADVRAAAIRTLGVLPGNRDLAVHLAKIASGMTDDGRAARQSLARLRGPDVGAAILSGAERGDAALRPTFIEQLALRNMSESVPLLLKLRSDSDPAVRAAALGALGELGTAKEQRAVIDWAMAATDDAEQSRGLRAIVSLTQRLPDEARRGQPVFTALERATPEVSVRVMPVLARIGGAPAAESAARLAVRNEPALATAAVDALGRWRDSTALRSLATVAETAALPDVKQSAWQAAVRYMERNRDPWSPELSDVVSRLVATAPEPKERTRVVALLPRANDAQALALAEKLQSDSQLGAAARDAAAVIRANLAGVPEVRGSGNASALKNIFDGKTSTRWNVPADGDEWLEIDFHLSRPIRTVTLDQTGRSGEHPERYELFVTDNLAQPGKPVATGTGQRTRTVVELPAGTRGRYLIIRNTEERKDSSWSVCELYVD